MRCPCVAKGCWRRKRSSVWDGTCIVWRTPSARTAAKKVSLLVRPSAKPCNIWRNLMRSILFPPTPRSVSCSAMYGKSRNWARGTKRSGPAGKTSAQRAGALRGHPGAAGVHRHGDAPRRVHARLPHGSKRGPYLFCPRSRGYSLGGGRVSRAFAALYRH